KEIPSEKQVKKSAELNVPIPADNLDFSKIAKGLAAKLPRDGALPKDVPGATKWLLRHTARLRDVVRPKAFTVKASASFPFEKDGLKMASYRLRLSGAWTVPVMELSRREKTKGTVVLLNDAGRKADIKSAEAALTAGKRVLMVDPFFFGESKLA